MERRPSPRALGQRRRGQALVEFAFASIVLLVLMLIAVEFGRHYYVRLTVRHSVSEGARFAATGQTLMDEESGEELTRAESIVRVIQRGAEGLPVALEELELDPPDGGGPGDVVRIKATYRFDFALPGVAGFLAPPSVHFVVATTVKNEPFFQ